MTAKTGVEPTPDPRDVARLDLLVDALCAASRAHLQPVLQQAIDGGAPPAVIGAALVSLTTGLLACTIVGATRPGDEPAMAALFCDDIRERLTTNDWARFRRDMDAAFADPGPTPRN